LDGTACSIRLELPTPFDEIELGDSELFASIGEAVNRIPWQN